MVNTKTISLSSKDLKNTITKLKTMSSDVSKLSTNLDQIMDEAVAYCIKESGNFAPHCRTYWEKTPGGYRIVQEGQGVIYVEFGTGVVGEASQHHPLQDEFGFKHNVGETIHETHNGKIGWFYPTGEAEHPWKFTQGQPARMQMYKTGEWLKNKLNVVVHYKIGEIVKKW